MTTTIGIILFCVAMFLVAWYLYKLGKPRSVYEDLIFLEMLITNSTGSEVDKKTIQVILNDYLSRAEYQCPKLYRLNQMFQKKFFNIEALRDKLTAIEVNRLESFDAVNSFEDAI